MIFINFSTFPLKPHEIVNYNAQLRATGMSGHLLLLSSPLELDAISISSQLAWYTDILIFFNRVFDKKKKLKIKWNFRIFTFILLLKKFNKRANWLEFFAYVFAFLWAHQNIV